MGILKGKKKIFLIQIKNESLLNSNIDNQYKLLYLEAEKFHRV